MLQKHDPGDLDSVSEFVAIEVRAGQAVLIPPGWAHGLANPFGEAGLLAGLYGRARSFPRRLLHPWRGTAAWRDGLILTDTGYAVEPNDAYRDVPVRSLDSPVGSPFEAEPAWVPLWSAAATDPSAFRFLSHTAEASARFGVGRKSTRDEPGNRPRRLHRFRLRHRLEHRPVDLLAYSHDTYPLALKVAATGYEPAAAGCDLLPGQRRAGRPHRPGSREREVADRPSLAGPARRVVPCRYRVA